MVGCGNSDFSASLYDAGHHDITNIDISSVAVEQMRREHAPRKGMVWDTEDARHMSFSAASFDYVLDKSLLDCMTFCDPAGGSDHENCIRDLVSESCRVLRPGGVAMFLTKASADDLLEHVQDAEKWGGLDWTVRETKIYAPWASDECKPDRDCVAVASRAELPPGRGYSVWFLFVCTKTKKKNRL